LTYNYIALGLPGSVSFATENGVSGILILSLFGLFAGWGLGWIWSERGSK